MTETKNVLVGVLGIVLGMPASYVLSTLSKVILVPTKHEKLILANENTADQNAYTLYDTKSNFLISYIVKVLAGGPF